MPAAQLTDEVSIMLLQNLREEVLEANLELVRRGLVLYTFGNASGISREEGLVVIKPSGIPYEELKAGAFGCYQSRGHHCRRQLETLLRSPYSSSPLSKVSGNRRRRAYPFRICHCLGTSLQVDSVFWDDSRGLFSRPGAGNGGDEEEERLSRTTKKIQGKSSFRL